MLCPLFSQQPLICLIPPPLAMFLCGCLPAQKPTLSLYLHSCTSSMQYVMNRPVVNPMNAKDQKLIFLFLNWLRIIWTLAWSKRTNKGSKFDLGINVLGQNLPHAPCDCLGSPEQSYPISLWGPHRKSHYQSGPAARSLPPSKGSLPLDGLENTADVKQQSTTEECVNIEKWQKQNCCFQVKWDVIWQFYFWLNH